ncbi:hypothetical protein BAUCODRAFT_459538 [Baudoinia panamericana UAMH 10762]|uniref:Uncharacterized protein n=1 Tax=Baudoinia panamericana (strain UAMH 10762) TaxID=717646 RepID=M2NF65_BAUPA|nr:uncharacterized protein BAUCODRAFT_459538 [Baudoinia panamericana UAMH 10762]EMC97615.1 hypothetical protein BAUCODRAFT_459538 [Baudoinia panamericana UAMH 10762]
MRPYLPHIVRKSGVLPGRTTKNVADDACRACSIRIKQGIPTQSFVPSALQIIVVTGRMYCYPWKGEVTPTEAQEFSFEWLGMVFLSDSRYRLLTSQRCRGKRLSR